MAEKTITQLASIDALATGDEFAVYDASASNTKKATAAQVKSFATDVDINGLTSASPATGDSVAIYDASAGANRKATISDILALGGGGLDINGLTAASPANGDYVPVYDTSASANRKATLSDVLALGGGGGGSGKFYLSLTPYAAEFPSSNHAPLTLVNTRPALAYDASTDESAFWTFAYPVGASGIDKVRLHWIAASATSGNVVWNVSVEAVTEADATNLGSVASFDTANAETTAVPATAGYMAVTEIALTNQDSLAAGDYVRIRVTRDADNGSDTATGDAYLLGVSVFDE